MLSACITESSWQNTLVMSVLLKKQQNITFRVEPQILTWHVLVYTALTKLLNFISCHSLPFSLPPTTWISQSSRNTSSLSPQVHTLPSTLELLASSQRLLANFSLFLECSGCKQQKPAGNACMVKLRSSSHKHYKKIIV